MPKSPDTSTVVKTKTQTYITIPKPLADQLDLKGGEKAKWALKAKGKLELNLQEREGK